MRNIDNTVFCEICSESWVEINRLPEIFDCHVCTMCQDNDIIDWIKRDFKNNIKNSELLDAGS